MPIPAQEVLPQPKPLAAPAPAPPPAPLAPLPPIGGSKPLPGPAVPLSLAEVLESVEALFPPLVAAEQERGIAAGNLLSAFGAFDFNLRAREDARAGTYENERFDVGFNQQLGPAGLSYFGGWRTGVGSFPNYYGMQKTADGGEFRAGVALALLQGNAIDPRRARVQTAEINRLLADPLVVAQRVAFFRNAGRAYWGWVAAGARVRVARQLRDLAGDRDAQLRQRVEGKALARLEQVDNQRALADRQRLLVVFERRYQQAAIELSLYLRSPEGPCVPGDERLPGFPPPPAIDMSAFEPALAEAYERRPEIRRYRLESERALVDLRLAENQLLPSVNLSVVGAQDLGDSRTSKALFNSPTDRSLVEAGLTFDLPVQRRDARGRIIVARSQYARARAQEQFAADTVRADVQDALSALVNATRALTQAREGVRLAEEVVEGENQRFIQGTSDILRVTLRELAAFDARFAEVDAQFEYFRALADFQAAIGFGGMPKPDETPPP